ncbi:MAG: BlaI/MecI/CopY family transcriptional regulator [Gemmatimonadota bacterium]
MSSEREDGYDPTKLSRRESQIMTTLYRLGRAGATEIRDGLDDPPGYSTVRKLLEILEEKGHVEHEREGRRYVYRPVVPREEARRSALSRVLRTFFDDSVEDAMAALLGMEVESVSAAELERIEKMARAAREKR